MLKKTISEVMWELITQSLLFTGRTELRTSGRLFILIFHSPQRSEEQVQTPNRMTRFDQRQALKHP